MSIGSAEALLQHAEQQVSQGRALPARAASFNALLAARVERDSHKECRAQLLLCHADILGSRLQSAYRLAQDLVPAFQRHGDAVGHVEALTLLSYTTASLGLKELSLDAAEQVCGLQDTGDAPETRRAAALNYRGVASFWAGDLSSAETFLEASLRYAAWTGAGAKLFHPLVNRCFTEVLRVDGLLTPRRVDFEGLNRSTAQLVALAKTESTATLNGVPPVVGLLLTDFISSYLAMCVGDRDDVDRLLGTFSDRAKKLPSNSWLHALPWWVRGAQAYRDGDIVAAQNGMLRLETLAVQGEHQSLARLARARQQRLLGHVQPVDEA